MLLQILLVVYKTEQNRDSDGLGFPPEITDNSNAQLKQQIFFQEHFSRQTCDLLFLSWVSINDVFYNETKQKMDHYILNIRQY